MYKAKRTKLYFREELNKFIKVAENHARNEKMLVLCNVTNKIRKCTDTAVAFTQEYSRVSYPLGNVSTLSTGSDGPRTCTHWCRRIGKRGLSRSRIYA